MFSENLNLGNSRITVINMPGLCHGSEKYARSPIHDRVIYLLKSSNTHLKTRFIPSADVREEDGALVGLQRPLSEQLSKLRDAIREVIDEDRTPVILAHCTGTLATVEALMETPGSYAALVSPVFLNPIREILYSRTFKRRFITHGLPDGDFCGKVSPAQMNYSTIFPSDHFEDDLYIKPISSCERRMEEFKQIAATRARIFVGEYDWNPQSHKYGAEFTVDEVPTEKHSFELRMQSTKRIALAIAKLVRSKKANQSAT
ncbi:hypothetical protein KKF55_01540 [Patescibacteria group bacterium]|nr:hypothetical protein [Patescibacteria group bacterium]